MISKVLIASLAVGASAFSPAAAGSVVSQSKVVAAAPVAPVSLERAVAPVMNADGEHETEYEMFDPLLIVVQTAPWMALLLKFGGVF